ncbi:MAG: hypothetical protein LBQ12_08360 [Deltaproteobacteria bacterium]|jgi:hypothetical protein|nr:hypothetical protein [Deltaproteobacteria bacterium]
MTFKNVVIIASRVLMRRPGRRNRRTVHAEPLPSSRVPRASCDPWGNFTGPDSLEALGNSGGEDARNALRAWTDLLNWLAALASAGERDGNAVRTPDALFASPEKAAPGGESQAFP